MAKIIKIRLTEYFPFQAGLSKKQQEIEGGPLDRMDKPLCTLEDYIEGKAPYVSVACDKFGGAPGKVAEFRKYNFKVWIPKICTNINTFLDTPIMLPIMIDFRLVDTGKHFYGDTKKVIVAGHEPIDVCRRTQPSTNKSFSGMLTELWLMGTP